MKLLAVFSIVICAILANGQDLDCFVSPSPTYSACKIDLTVAVDMSIAMGNQNNVNLLTSSVYDLFTRYNYDSNTETSLITFGVGGIDTSNYVSDLYTLCTLLKSEKSHSQQNGLFNASLESVLQSYHIKQPDNARNYQRVLVLITAIDDSTQVLRAKPIADTLRIVDNVQIITVLVGHSYTNYLYLLGNQSYTSLSYSISPTTLNSINYASCLNSGYTYGTSTPYAIDTYPSRAPFSPSPSPSTIVPAYSTPSPINGTDGRQCATAHSQAWLDIVLVIERSSATADQWLQIVGNVVTYLSELSLSNTLSSSHTSRVAIVGYDESSTATLLYSFTDTQKVKNIQFALNQAKPSANAGKKANIASGLRFASNYLNTHKSFRVQGVVLYAATYDDSATSNPVTAATELKENLIKILTISFEAINGVTTPKIAALSSPGLSLTSKDKRESFGWAVSQLNCRCPGGWTQFVVDNEISYADCFAYQTANNLQAFTACDTTQYPSNTLALAYSPARVDFLGQLVSNLTDTPTTTISIGLSRSDAYSDWTWQNVLPYDGYPPFARRPQYSDVFGYLSKQYDNWQLYADDGMTDSRFYVCQIVSCDTDNICDLKGN